MGRGAPSNAIAGHDKELERVYLSVYSLVLTVSRELLEKSENAYRLYFEILRMNGVMIMHALGMNKG